MERSIFDDGASTVLRGLDHLTVESSGQGPITVFIHGLGEGRHHWRGIISDPRLQGRNVTYDLAGHGDSSWLSDGCYQTTKHVLDLLAVLNHFPHVPIILIGHSMGGEIAIRAAALGIDNLCGVILVDCGLDNDDLVAEQIERELQSTPASFADVASYRQWLIAHRPLVTTQLLDELVRSSLRPLPSGGFSLKRDPAVFKARARDGQASAEAWEALGLASCPTLIIRGAASSYLSPSVAQKMAQRAKSGELKTVPRAGHGIAVENPEGLLCAILPFLSANLWNPKMMLHVRE